MNVQAVRVGVVGCGDIADRRYLPGFVTLEGQAVLAGLYDRDTARLAQAAETYGARAFPSLDALLGSSEIDAVINITPPRLHYPINLAILRAGKHLLTEKPMALSLEEAATLIAEARARDLTMVCAPAITASAFMRDLRHLLHAGVIGRTLYARAQLSTFGPAAWAVYTSDPTWFYQEGAGPLQDLGVYPLHMLTELLGPVRRLTAFSGISVPRRTVLAGPARGKQIAVQVDDNTQMLLDFGDNVFAQLDASYCAWSTPGPQLELYGSEGVLVIDNIYDPHCAPRLWRGGLRDNGAWETIAPMSPAIGPTRGLYIFGGVTHLITCLRRGRAPLLSAEHAMHVLEIMLRAGEAARAGRICELQTVFPYPKHWDAFEEPAL